MKLQALLVILGMTAVAAFAKWRGPDMRVPTSKLIENARAALAKNPKSADLEYLLGRLYSLRFAQGNQPYEVYSDGGPAGFAFSTHGTYAVDIDANAKRRLSDWQSAYVHYLRAAKLDPKSYLAAFGTGFVLEQGAPFASKLRIDGKRKSAQWFKKGALDAYRKAFALSWKQEDWKNSMLDTALVVVESGQAMERLLPKSSATRAEREMIAARLKTINDAPRGITPIIFPLRNRCSMVPLIDESATVDFDLAGDHAGKRWPWVSDGVGFLAYDLSGDGIIADGRELFGTGTFWMLFKDGYAAMRSLDANGDGWLSGEELAHVVVWCDRNLDARSGKGEVTDVRHAGILAIRARPDAGRLSSSMGIVWRDGVISPTLDWIARPKGA